MPSNFFGFDTIGSFVQRVKEIREPDEMRTFFDLMVTRAQHSVAPLKNPEAVVRSNIGYCFGKGMDVEIRKMWYETCHVEHPVLGRMDRELTPEELFRAGFEYAERRSRATSWERLMRDRDDTP